MVYEDDTQQSFMGSLGSRTISEATQQQVDAEVRRILDEQYALAYKLIDENRDKMETMTNALMQWETIDADQVKEIMAGKEPSPPKDYSHNVRSEAEIAAAAAAVVESSDTAADEPKAETDADKPSADLAADSIVGEKDKDQNSPKQ